MKTVNLSIAVIVTFLLTQSLTAQDFPLPNSDDSVESKFRQHSIELRISYLNQKNSGVTVKSGPFTVDAGIGGIGGKVAYNYYPNYTYAFFISVGGSTPEVSVNHFSNHTSTVGTIMMGMKYFVLEYPKEDFFRPYLAVGMEMVIGTESDIEILNVGTHTESAMGGYAGFGAELLISRWFKFSSEIGYNLVTDFTEEVGSRKNYSGMEFSFGVGFMF